MRLTSGREIVIAIDRPALLERLSARLRRSPEIAAVESDAPRSRSPYDQTDRLVVRLAPGEAARRLSVIACEPESASEATALAESLAGDSRYTLTACALDEQRLAVMVDTRQYVFDLAQRLSARADVAYAQPNFSMQHYRPDRAD